MQQHLQLGAGPPAREFIHGMPFDETNSTEPWPAKLEIGFLNVDFSRTHLKHILLPRYLFFHWLKQVLV